MASRLGACSCFPPSCLALIRPGNGRLILCSCVGETKNRNKTLRTHHLPQIIQRVPAVHAVDPHRHLPYAPFPATPLCALLLEELSQVRARLGLSPRRHGVLEVVGDRVDGEAEGFLEEFGGGCGDCCWEREGFSVVLGGGEHGREVDGREGRKWVWELQRMRHTVEHCAADDVRGGHITGGR